jgi:type IV secretion system protein VirD4
MSGYPELGGSAPGLTVGLVGLAVLAWDRWRAFGRRPDSHGDSRWAAKRELRYLHSDVASVHGAVIGWQGSTLLRLPDEDNLLVFGVQRSGKTSTVVIPSLLGWPGAVVATSTKDELVALTGRDRAARTPVYVFAPLDSDTAWVDALGLHTVAWNPVADITTSGAAAELADVFTADGKASHSPHWYLSAANLLTGLFLVANHLQGDLSMVLGFLSSSHLPAYAMLGKQTGGWAETILAGFSSTPPEEAGSIISTARAALSLWLDDRVASATSLKSVRPQLDLDALLAGGGTLYLVAPAEDAERCRPLFSALLEGVLRRATTRARAQGGVLHPRLLLALDEAANFARVPRLTAYVSTGPGQGIQSILCFHDLAQIRAGYGPDGAGTIWNNCRARLLLPGQADLATLELFSRSLGQETVVFKTKSWSQRSHSNSQHHTGRALCAPDQLRQSANPILIFGSAPPARLTLRRWDQVPQWRALVPQATRQGAFIGPFSTSPAAVRQVVNADQPTSKEVPL